MTIREVEIVSYFSLETDLAAEFRSFSEFVSGDGYRVALRSESERVEVGLDNDKQPSFVFVRGDGTGTLFERVVGRTVYALAAHSDNLQVGRVS